MNLAFKLVLNFSLLACWSSCLIGKVPSKKKDHLHSWPSSNAPKATWAWVDTTTHQKNAHRDSMQYVDSDSSYFTGKFKGKAFTLRYLKPRQGQFERGILLLSIDGKEDLFTPVSSVWRLEWAGDSDKDGKLDLIIKSVGDGGGTSTDLFLSSLAGVGELVKHSAILDHEDGC